MARKLVGTVLSDKMDKTVVVGIDRLREHSLYRKKYKVTKKIKAHNEENKAKTGDTVQIVETAPISKDKRWKVEKILKQTEVKG
ncbi:MAG: 30S ribosomal protein S17 [Candidatus Saccharimonadales bacterium]